VTTVALITQSPTSNWLELDSKFCGFPKSIEGGDVYADVIPTPAGPDGIVRKHIANVNYEDIVLTCGADMSDSVYDWIAAMLNRTYTSKNGAIVVDDMTGRSRLEFVDALIHEITFPALDASSQDAAAIEIKLTSSHLRTVKNGSELKAEIQSKKQWSVSNFRLQIDGLDLSRVIAIDALTISRDLPPDQIGIYREPQQHPVKLNLPNLAFTIAKSEAASLISWHEDFLINGHHLQTDEKSGSLQFLAANLQDVLFTLTLHNLGIFKLKKVAADLGSIPRLRAEVYCEEMGFEYKGATTGSTAATQNFSRPPLRGDYAQGLAKIAVPIAGQTQPPPLLVGNAPNLGWPLRFRG
jgi:T4-like virus tail tube protein gp19